MDENQETALGCHLEKLERILEDLVKKIVTIAEKNANIK